ncbi:hypothetical protein K6982_18365 [Xanthomonas cucurbitae]|nr:hypothetical protein K6982_18365 [Xanthomonas cucurbitae]WDM78980.1 hypothetical protein K6980_18025 [Xanthomonas cucurbitae]WDM82663.1 hypothetical protein K6979_18020 [Xanthomonas cucurbitae]
MTQVSHRARSIALATLSVAMVAPLAWGQGYPPMGQGGREAMPAPARGGSRTLSDTIRHVQRSTGGQILGAERVPFDGGNLNRVKYMKDGRVHTVYEPEQQAQADGPRAPPSGTPPRDDNH